MSIQGKLSLTLSLPGVSISATVSRPAAGGVPPQEVSLAAAEDGSLTTRTSDTAGTLTMDDAGHGITDGDSIVIFWAAGVAYKATVGTVSGTSVPFTGADGDVLPAQDTDVTVDVIEELDVDFDGDNLELFAANMDRRGFIIFEDSGDAELDAEELIANEPYLYVDGMTASNPLTGNPVDQVLIANGDSSNTATFKMGGTYNSDA